MTKEKVDKMLSNYKEYVARCNHLELCIGELEKTKEEWMRTMVEDTVVITATLSDMPRRSGISDPTGTLGTAFASGEVSNPVKQIEKEIASCRRELKQKMPTVVFVGAWLKCLTDRERFVLEKKLSGDYWRNIVFDYTERFGETYSKEGLKRIRDSAVSKIYKMAE